MSRSRLLSTLRIALNAAQISTATEIQISSTNVTVFMIAPKTVNSGAHAKPESDVKCDADYDSSASNDCHTLQEVIGVE
jgi:hypothetical protein